MAGINDEVLESLAWTGLTDACTLRYLEDNGGDEIL